MSTTINGITSYEVRKRGLIQEFIRVAVVNTVDVAGMDADETSAATTFGSQTISLGDTALGTDATGLANDATSYTANITVNGVVVPIAVTGSAAQTVTTLIAELNTDLGANATAALTGGNIIITSDNGGNESYVSVVDVDLFSTLTAFVGILAGVDGGMKGAMIVRTLGNGANAWEAYKSAVETYNPNADRTIVATNAVAVTDSTTGTANDTLVDVGAAFSQATLNDNFADVAAKINALTTKVNALQDLVEKLVLHK